MTRDPRSLRTLIEIIVAVIIRHKNANGVKFDAGPLHLGAAPK